MLHGRSRDKKIALVDLRPEGSGSFLEELAVTALVFLERTDDLPCKLSSILSSGALTGLLRKVRRDGLLNEDLVRELSLFVTRVPAYRLCFTSNCYN